MWVLAGCSLVVSGDPTVHCTGDEGCPATQRCAKASGTCIDEDDACTESSCSEGERCDPDTLRCVDATDTPDATEPDAEDTPDAVDSGQPDADGPTPGVVIGALCASQSDCRRIEVGSQKVRGICAIQSLTGFDTPSFCTTHCCTNSDCPSDFFCEHGPSAGRYCVPFGKDTRALPSGDKRGGATCSEDTECASGSCGYAVPSEPDLKTCLDTCCADDDCETGLTCGLRDGDTLQWVCRTAVGSGNANADCSAGGAESCRTGACYGDLDAFCTASCCSNASCVSLGLTRCVSGSTAAGTSRVNICADDSSGANAGTPCSTDGECTSNICVNSRCASTCCTDGDCPDSASLCVADGNEPRPHCAANTN